MMKKIINISIILISSFLIIYLTIITYQVVTINKNWSWSIDFADKNNIISNYGSLAASIVALISSILLVYTIFTQLSQFKKQTKQFNKQLSLQEEQFQKQFSLQQDQYDDDKKRLEYEEKKDMYFQLRLVNTFLIYFLEHIKVMSTEIRKYYEFESQFPLLHSNLQFQINKDAERLNKLESLSLFKTFQFFFENHNENWISDFNDLFGSVSFYDEVLKELLPNNKKHTSEKYDSKLKIGSQLNGIIERTKMIAIEYRKRFENYETQPYYSSLENLLERQNNYLKELEQQESNFDYISQNLLLPFLKEIDGLIKNPNDDKFGIIELSNLISNLRKEIYFIKSTALIYSKNMEKRYIEYFSEGNHHLKKIEQIQNNIQNRIAELNLEDLKVVLLH
jgi:type II secretory pathway pseudopilin PulG